MLKHTETSEIIEGVNLPFKAPRNRYYGSVISYCEGPQEIGNVSANDDEVKKIWKAYIDSSNFICVADESTGEESKIYQHSVSIVDLDFCFDQLNQVFLVFTDITTTSYRFNFAQTKYSLTQLPTKVSHCRCELDKKEKKDSSTSDIIISYLKDNKLCYLVQREGFLQERVIKEVPVNSYLYRIGELSDGSFGFWVV